MIGKAGSMINSIREEADLQGFFDHKIHFKLWVRVDSDWRRDEGADF
jgi:GTPase Era involved in 16S rRNA processing